MVNVRQVLAVKLIKIAVVRRMMLRPVPPVPIAAFRNEDLVKGELPLLFGGPGSSARIKIAGMMQVVPGAVVLGSANPHVEVRIDPGPRH